MKLTPIDVQQQSFRKKLNGVDGEEVATYLDMVARELEEIIRENRDLKNELSLREREIMLYKEQEAAIKETMVAAQKATDELKEQARREADIMISDAELRAEKIVENAHSRMVGIMEELGELRRQKLQFQENLKGLINAHAKLLDLNEELAADDGNTSSNVTYLPRSSRFDNNEHVELPVLPSFAAV